MIKFLPGKRGVPRIIALAWLYRSAALLWLLTISATAFGYCTETNEWTEDALLHTGKILKINREVCHTLQIFSGDGGSPGFLKSWPDKYWLKFRHPDTQETIKWQGEQYFSPVLLDFVDGIPYLVVHGQPDKETEKIYGCPELPYIFLKYESGIFGKWKVIPVEQFPLVLQDANLSPNPDLPSMSQDMCRDYGGKSCGIFSRDDVLWNIHKVEQSSGGGFQAKIPRGYDTWYSDYKNSHKNERRRNDCRPPRPPPAKVELPPPQEVDLEILDTKDHSPEQVMGQEE